MLKKVAVAHYGSQEKVALALEIRRQSVQKWPDVVPRGKAYELQVRTCGKLRVDPSLYEPEDRRAHA